MKKRFISHNIERKITLDNVPPYGGEAIQHVLSVINRYEAKIEDLNYSFIEDNEDQIKIKLLISCDSAVWADIEDDIDNFEFTHYKYFDGITTGRG